MPLQLSQQNLTVQLLKKTKILFISHDAYRAGAQLLLLQLLKWIKSNEKNIECHVFLVKGGILEEEFKEIGIVYEWTKKFDENSFIGRVKKKQYYQDLKKRLLSANYDLIYANTISNGDILHVIGLENVPVITHVHEMNYWIKKIGNENLSFTKIHTTKYIAVSDSVKKILMNDCSINGDQIEVIHGFTYALEYKKELNLKEHLGLSEDAIIIGGCGAENWRKGKDLFILTAILTLQEMLNGQVHFVWIGGVLNEELKYDLLKSGFSNQIHFINHLPDASNYFSDFTVFCMTSREDPFPLVNLEAGLREIPIVCFDDAGGTVELVECYKNMIIPYGNIKLMSERIMELIHNERLRKEIGRHLKEKIESELLIDQIAGKLVNVMKNVIHESTTLKVKNLD